MNFDLTEEQQMIVDAVSKFVDNDSPVTRFRELRTTDTGWDPKVWQQMGEYGWLAVGFPEEQGGYGGSFVDTALILEQLGRTLVPEPYIASVVLAGELLSRLGSSEQVADYLAPMIEGRTSLALAYAEKQSRYNLSDCRTLAKRQGEGYVLSGEKVWVLNGHAADQIVVVARSAGSQCDRDGLSLFIVDGDAPGLTRSAVKGMDGHTTALLRLENVEVGAERRLGDEGGALAELERAVDRGAAAACAEAQGSLGCMFTSTVEYLRERKQFGRAIGSFQALQHKAADMFAETELCKSAMILAAIGADEDDATARASAVSAAKLQFADGGWFVQENAVQLFGGIAITDEQDVGLFFKRVRVLNGLFGDADYHVGRYANLETFTA